MNKKLSLFVITALITTMCFTGCGNHGGTQSSSSSSSSAADSSSASGSEASSVISSEDPGSSTESSTDSEISSVVQSDSNTSSSSSKNSTSTKSSSTSKTTSSATSKPAVTPTKSPTGSPVFTGEDIEVNYNPAGIDLKYGVTAVDSSKTSLTVKVINNGGYTTSKIGKFTVTYQAADSKGNTTTYKRNITVKYFGLSQADLSSKTSSQYTSWSFKDAGENPDRSKYMAEWSKYIVPSDHDTAWNLFEDAGFCINMRGSDTQGHNSTTGESEDDLPNTILWNKVAVPQNRDVVTLNLSCPLFPDYNNMISKFRLTAIDIATSEVIRLQDWTETKIPDVNLTFDINASRISGKNVILLLEQDSAKDVLQDAPAIFETRDSLFVYGISIKAKEIAPTVTNVPTVTTAPTTAPTIAVTDIPTPTVTKEPTPTVPVQDPPVITGGDVTINYGTTFDLLSGIVAKDGKGNSLTPKVMDDNEFSSSVLGSYTIQYEAEDSFSQKATFTRKVTVGYFGLLKEDFNSGTVSAYTGWSFKGADINPDRSKYMGDWNKYIVPSGHSTNWNLFEDGGFCINMRGSDTEGRNPASQEVEDDLPNTMLWNRVQVPYSMNTITLNASCPLFPDYNNLNARVKLTAVDMQTFEVITLLDWTETNTPDPNTTFTINASQITGKDVTLILEQDSAKDVIQTAPVIVETRDGLFVYGISMGYTAINLFNKNTMVTGKYISFMNGILNDNADYGTSDFIVVHPNATYTINWFDQVAWFDSNHVFISGVDGYQAGDKTITAPANAAFLRVSVRLVKVDAYQIYEVRSVKSMMQNILYSAVKTHIKLLGDSITMGVGGTGFAKDGEVIVNPGWAVWNVNTKGYCWANLFKTQIESNYNCGVKNWGTDGVDSAFILDQINKGNLIEADDELVILMIGTNDRLNYSGMGSSELLYQNLCAIVDKVHAMNKEIILMSSIPASDANENSVTEPKIFHMPDVDKAVCRAASSKGVEYISLYQQFTSYVTEKGITIDSLLSDGLHPNDAGYKVMADLIFNALGC